jgi:outer membrane immunogenic protein
MMKHDLIGVRGSAFGVALAFATISTSVLAADLGAGAPAAYTKAPAYVPVSNWTGLYIGGNVGYGWGNNSGVTAFATPVSTILPNNFVVDPQPKGVLGGGQIGYNWQIGSIVTGIEADIQGASIRGSRSALFPFGPAVFAPPVQFVSADEKLSWFGTVRGRLGATVTPALLVYATGGLAYGHVNQSDNSAPDLFPGDAFPVLLSKTQVGWTAGAGAEWMFAGHWSLKAEYLFIDLGKVSGTSLINVNLGNVVTYNSKIQDNIARFGVNYHFN